jgi:hypothetical protein
MQISGIGLVGSVTLLAAIGDIHRFPTPAQLVGYAGLGAKLHESGLTTHRGGITKAGRKDLRAVLVEAAQIAVIHDPRWEAEFHRLEPRIGHNRAIVAIARKILELVWHLLAGQTRDFKLDPDRLACKFLEFAYMFERQERGNLAPEFVRERLDFLGVGREMQAIRQGHRRIPLPPSSLPAK